MLETRYTCPTMIGRQREVDALSSLYGHVSAGQGRTVLVAGEAGVGKSRLLSRLVEQAREQNWTVLVGHCYPQDVNLPYAPLLDALRTHFHPLSRSEIAALLGAYAPEIIKLLPELARLFPEVQTGTPVEPQAEKRRLFEAIYGLLAELAHDRPLLLAFEDLHWADDTSLELLHLLARRISGDAILLVTTYRLDEPVTSPGSPWLRRIADLERERLATEMRLDPLPQTDVRTMLQLIFDVESISQEFTAAIYSRTEGNPFFVEELLKALVESGDVFYSGGVWDRKALDELNLPRSVREAIWRHLDGLEATALQVSSTAAAIGRRFDFDLLRAVTALPEGTLVSTIRALISQQLVSLDEQAPEGAYRFRHALTRDAIYSRLLPQERKATHRSIAETMEGLYAGNLEARSAELAYHFWEAGAWAKALGYSEQAGERALVLYAPHAAIEHLTRALKAAEHLVAERSRVADARLYSLRGQAYETLGDFEAARADLEMALRVARETGDNALEWQSLLDLGFVWAGRDYARVGDYFKQALDLARKTGDQRALANSLNRFGNWLVNTGRPAEGLVAHHEALSIFRGQADKKGTADTLDLLGMGYGIYGDSISSIRSLEQAIEIYREIADNRGLASSLISYAAYGCPSLHDATLAVPGMKEVCLSASDEALSMASRMDWQAGQAYALFARGSAYSGFGKLGAGLRYASESLRVATEIEHQQWIAGAHYTLSGIYIFLLDAEAAIEHARAGLRLGQTIGSKWWSGLSTRSLASACLMKGDLAGAEEALLAAVPARDDTWQPQSLPERRMLLVWGELALAQGSVETALQVAERLLASVPVPQPGSVGAEGEMVDPASYPVPPLLKLKGEALLALGRTAEGLQALEEASRGAVERDSYPVLWQVQAALARAHKQLKHEDRARAQVEAARRIIEDMAATIDDLALRESFLREAFTRLPYQKTQQTPRRESYLAGLTPREVEVLKLVASGKSNRQVAETLFLSERTVETYLTSILSKTNTDNRAGATAFAFKHHLL